MTSSDRLLFNRQATLHHLLGAGLFADVILWRDKNVTITILIITLASWMMFEKSDYTLLSYVSNVLLLLLTILFLWAKSAQILNSCDLKITRVECRNLYEKSLTGFVSILELKMGLFDLDLEINSIQGFDSCNDIYFVNMMPNRPTPPIPHLQLSEETVSEVATIIRDRTNMLLSVSYDIALGKDPKMFFKVAAYLVLISVIGSLTDFRTLCYTSIIVALTVPVAYERYEAYVDSSLIKGNVKLKKLYIRFDEEFIKKVKKWILEKNKLS